MNKEPDVLGLILGLAGQASVAAAVPDAASASIAARSPIAASAPVNTRANELFDRDSTLKAWAIRIYDTNRDGWLTLFEAQPALIAFKDMADGNRDGRITTYEYNRAREFIVARR
jgi:hypothetical protein